MRFVFIAISLCVAAPAFAEGGDEAPKAHKKCKTPQCHCNDTTSSTECIDADACAKFCEDHGGAVKMHKRHPRHGHGDAHNADEDDKF